MTQHADIDAISAHIERHVGRVHMVFHEIVSDELHIDIHHVKSSLFRAAIPGLDSGIRWQTPSRKPT